jgi:hypothetical protein
MVLGSNRWADHPPGWRAELLMRLANERGKQLPSVKIVCTADQKKVP